MILTEGVTIARGHLEVESTDGSRRKSDAIIYTFDLGNNGELQVAIPVGLGELMAEGTREASSAIVHAATMPPEPPPGAPLL